MFNWVPFDSQLILWVIAVILLVVGFAKEFIAWVVGKRHKE